MYTLEIFWWEEDYCCSANAELERETPLYSARVKYSNGEIQDIGSMDDIPNPVLGILFALAELFE